MGPLKQNSTTLLFLYVTLCPNPRTKGQRQPETKNFLVNHKNSAIHAKATLFCTC